MVFSAAVRARDSPLSSASIVTILMRPGGSGRERREFGDADHRDLEGGDAVEEMTHSFNAKIASLLAVPWFGRKLCEENGGEWVVHLQHPDRFGVIVRGYLGFLVAAGRGGLNVS